MKCVSGTFDLGLIRRCLLAVLGAVLYFTGFVGFDLWYLSWVCLVPLFFALEGLGPRQAFLIGWLYGTVTLTGGFYWLTYTLHVFAFLPWAVAGFVCLLLCIVQATEFAVFGYLYTKIRKGTGRSAVIVGTVVFTAVEFLSPQLFPHYLGNSQYKNVPLIQVCDITGVAGVTALIVLVNASIYRFAWSVINERRFRHGPLITAAAAVVLVLVYGYLRLPVVDSEMAGAPKLRFGIVQANLGIREKNDDPQKAVRLNRRLTERLNELGADIAVWPESTITSPILASNAKKVPAGITEGLGIPVIFGAIQRGLYNVAVLSDSNGDILGIYRKQKLLMFGEYIPFGDIFPALYEWMPYVGRMVPGDSSEPLKFGDRSFGISICYEDILPRLINRMAEYYPDVFVNLTNDNWYGRTHEPMQHLALALFRSVEHRRWLVRSTNTGISAFVDAAGRIVERSPLMEESVIMREVPMMKSGTVYSYLGDWFSWTMVLVTVFLGLFLSRKNTRC